MADPFKESVGELARNVRALVSQFESDVDYRTAMEGRVRALEIWVRILIAVDAAIALGILGLIITRAGKIFGG